MPDDPTTPAFVAAVAAAEASTSKKLSETVSGPIYDFCQSQAWDKPRQSTRAIMALNLKAVEMQFGSFPLAAMSDRMARVEFLDWHDKLAKEYPRAADAKPAAFARVLSWAYDRGRIERNPIDKFSRAYSVDRSDTIWPPEHVDALTESASPEAAADVGEAVFVGTSRGGLITMAIASFEPDLIRGTVLNDIGPVLQPEGIDRIRGYVGNFPAPADWAEAVGIIKGYAGEQFTALSNEDWMAFAQTTYGDRDGTLTIRYDPALKRALEDLDTSDLPTLWPQFEALRRAPLMVIRGEHSDLLSKETADIMIQRHPDACLVTVGGQGHAPLLRDAPTLARIGAFILHCDGVRHVSRPG